MIRVAGVIPIMIIPIENQHSYDAIHRNRDLKLSISNHCDAPSRVLVVDWKGDCFLCSCEAWLPVSVGKISDFSRLADIWSNTTACALQDDISQRKFTHCAVDRCGILDSSITYDQYLVSINIDESCNLACPSCRKDSVMITSGPVFDRKLAQVNHMVDMLEMFEQPCRVVMSGNGDPLASAIMRPLIHRWQPRSNHSIRLFTNGLLLKKQLADSPVLAHVAEYFISIDAGSAPVYERVRLGGSWDRLLENFDWLRDQVAQQPARVLLMLVVQRENYHDVNNFCQLVNHYGFDGSITYLEDWGTWSDFPNQDVIGNEKHPEHGAAVQALRQAYQTYKNSSISFGSKLLGLVT